MDADLCNICHVSLFVMRNGRADCLRGFTLAYVGALIRWCLYWRTNAAVFMYFTKEAARSVFKRILRLFTVRSHFVWWLGEKRHLDCFFLCFLTVFNKWQKTFTSKNNPLQSSTFHLPRCYIIFCFSKPICLSSLRHFPLAPHWHCTDALVCADYMKNASAGEWSGAGAGCGLIQWNEAQRWSKTIQCW